MFALEGAGRRSARVLVVAIATGLALSACNSGGNNGSGGGVTAATRVVSGDLSAVCAQGVTEGSFNYWATDEAEDFAKIEKVFTAAHPGIKVNYLNLPSGDAVPRILTATAAKKDPGVDLLNGNITNFDPLWDRELMDQAVKWSALGVPAEYVGGPNLVVSDREHFGIAYNTEKLKPADLPATWEQLIDPKWKGQVVVDPRGYPFREMSASLGVEKTIDYMHRLNDVVHPIVIQGGTASMTDVGRGEALIGTLGLDSSVPELQAKGAPVAVKFLDIVPSSADWSLLLKDAAHPNAAACYVGWMSTPEGQKTVETALGKTNTERPPGVAANVPAKYPSTKEDLKAARTVTDEAGKLWGKK